MRVYSENIKNQFYMLLNEDGLLGDEKRQMFVQQRIMPFLFNLMDEIVANDNLEKLEHEIFHDNGAGMAITTNLNGKSCFAIEENSFFSRWVKYNKQRGLSKALKNKYLINDIQSVFHEERHHKQHNLMREKDILKMTPYNLIYIKEDFILKSDYEWYRQNHGKFWIEIEAHLNGYYGCSDFLSSVLPNSELAEQYKEKLKHEIDILVKPNEYLKGDNPSSHLISKKFDELIKNASTFTQNVLQNLFEQYPVLSIIYNQDGTKKSIEDILSIKKQIITANLSNLQKIICVGDTKTTLASHINKTFSIIINSDKDLQSQYEKYMAKNTQLER